MLTLGKSDPISILWNHVRYQHRIPDLICRLLVSMLFKYDGQWTRYCRPIDLERDAASHHVLANAHWIFGTSPNPLLTLLEQCS